MQFIVSPLPKNLENLPPGSAEWLIQAEKKFGGYTDNVKRNKVSPNDPRSSYEIEQGGMIGGDRMKTHQYAQGYAEYLAPYLNEEIYHKITVAEFGILKGTGLAIWCELFKTARILGFDIDLSHIKNNLTQLEKLSAFQNNNPELNEYDQFVDNRAYLQKILQQEKINICIDDGHHSDESIITTLDSVAPYLADDFVYFIEDNSEVHEKIASRYPNFMVDSRGELTILKQK